jgi:TPR repeat protein
MKAEMQSKEAQSLLQKYQNTLHNFQDATPSRGIVFYLAAARRLRILLGISTSVEIQREKHFFSQHFKVDEGATVLDTKHQHKIILQYLDMAASDGNPEAHRMLGMIHSNGLLSVDSNPSLSLLHYHHAAASGDAESASAMGFRHYHGVGVVKDCDVASVYYEYAANAAMHDMDHRTLLTWVTKKKKIVFFFSPKPSTSYTYYFFPLVLFFLSSLVYIYNKPTNCDTWHTTGVSKTSKMGEWWLCQ